MPKKHEIKDTFADGTKRSFAKGISLQEIIRMTTDVIEYYLTGAKVDNQVRNLVYCLEHDCHVELLNLNMEMDLNIYRNRQNFQLIHAANDLYPACLVSIEHSLGKVYTVKWTVPVP